MIGRVGALGEEGNRTRRVIGRVRSTGGGEGNGTRRVIGRVSSTGGGGMTAEEGDR